MVWAILDDYFFTPIEVTRETAQTVFYVSGGKERNTRSALPWRGSEDEARRIGEQLKSASAEMNARRRAATVWFNKRKAELTGASQ